MPSTRNPADLVWPSLLTGHAVRCVLAVLVLSVAPAAQAQSLKHGLFTAAASPNLAAGREPDRSTATAVEFVNVSLAVFGDGSAALDAVSPLELDVALLRDGNGRPYVAEPHAFSVLPSGRLAWTGRLAGVELSSVTLIIDRTASTLTGSISFPGGNYSIQPAVDAVHVVLALDSARFAPDDVIEPPAPSQVESRAPDSPLYDDGSRIDVLVVYTPAARNAAGGVNFLESQIDLAVTETNLAYQNSGIIPRVRLVGTAEVGYTETGDWLSAINRLQNPSDGHMDAVHGWRDSYGADIVTLISVESTAFCGIAYSIGNGLISNAPNAFNIVRQSCLLGNFVFAHEIGHIQSARHDWYMDPTDNSPFRYNHGFTYGTLFRTVMAYPNGCGGCERIQYFSNPNVSYQNHPVGVPDGFPNAADNRLTLNNTAFYVANYRLEKIATFTDGFNPGANGKVDALALQSDGKIVVGGYFTTLGGGGTGTKSRNNLGRLNPDGSLDTTFNPGTNNGVLSVAVQRDGRILVGGVFTTIGGGGIGSQSRTRLARLTASGTVDLFNASADGGVYTIVEQPDGKILIGGNFNTVNGVARNHVARLLSSGALDLNFDPGADGSVYALALQPDGKILVGGNFQMLGGGGTGTTVRIRMGRLNPDGSLDPDFDPVVHGTVHAMAVQPDGKVLIGGNFTFIRNTTTRNYVARLLPNGVVDTGFDPGTNGRVNALILQPDGRILVGGYFTTVGGGGTAVPFKRLARIMPDGSVDNTFAPLPNDEVLAIALQQDEKVVVGGLFMTLGSTGLDERSHIGRLNANGSVDIDIDPRANDAVRALAVQPDGMVLVGGLFTKIGNFGQTTRNRIARLREDGRLDAGFFSAANGIVNTVALQPDGRILVGGSFTGLGGLAGDTPRNFLGRVTSNGTLESSFDPGANDTVTALAIQPDGKILVAGYFTTMGGGGAGSSTRQYLARLNADGSLDTGFNPGANAVVFALAVQPDGKIIVGGYFTGLGGGTGTTARSRIGRLNPDGSVDTSFDPGANAVVTALALQADGRIVVGGDFGLLGSGGIGSGVRHKVGRLHSDGSLDAGFNPGANGVVATLAIQPDGKILAGGSFTNFGGGGTGTVQRLRIARVDASGTVDESFNPGANSDVVALAVAADGKVVVGGGFTGLGGGVGSTRRDYIGRVASLDGARQTLSAANSGRQVFWSRGGAGPEVTHVTFESSTDGSTFAPLGDGVRNADGWQLNSQNLPQLQNLFIRARGQYGTGLGSGAVSIVDSVRNVYLMNQSFTDDPLVAGTTVVRAVHLRELRTRTNAMRARYGLPEYPFLEPTIFTGATTIGVQHIVELRTALAQAYSAAAVAPPTFTDPALTAGTMIRAAHISELRAALVAIE